MKEIISKILLAALNFLVVLTFINQSLVNACLNLDLTQVPGECTKFYRCSNGLYLYTMRFFKKRSNNSKLSLI